MSDKRKLSLKDFDGFSINLILDDDGDWLAHFTELPNVSAFGSDPEEAVAELKVAWTAFKQSCQKHNDPVPDSSGQRIS